jgi:choline dehydrogenase-like flavoprotein
MSGQESPLDAVVVGTGFGGAVASCRLAQAGKRVCVLERGRRYGLADFPRPATRPDKLPYTARWAWAFDHGLWDVRDLHGALAIQAAGYGGGSLVYANVHLRPPKEVFARPTKGGRYADGWPACYTLETLAPYYDVAAAALRVRPVPTTLLPPAVSTGPLPKVEVMRSAAKALGREGWFFLPPLAIDFDKCTMCGECVAGCQVHAKNTLDLNYLAVAERFGVDVRTLAEVVNISEDPDRLYTVTYRDHITANDAATVRARSVFLCAGSVGSTQILLRSRDGLPMPDASKAHIGRRFFANGDGIAMVYDTQPTPVPTRGPTITTSLLYNQSAPDPTGAGTSAEWFLVQDGGYPKWLESVMGLFRGDFWLQRNRITRARGERAPDAAIALPETADVKWHAEHATRALLSVLHSRHAFRGDPGARAQADLDLDDLLPRQIREQLIPHAREFLHRLEKGEADPISHQTLAELAQRTIADVPKWLQGIARWIAAFIEKKVDGNLLDATLEIVHRHYLKAPPNTAEPYTAKILWPLGVDIAKQLFLGKSPDDHAFLMLVMGIDAAPGRLYLDDQQRLLAYWDRPANAPLATMQERLVHDIADELGGEMRMNPDATTRQRPVTVHNLGGCAMSDKPDDGVTDSNGKVWGTRALYVLDGAAIPGSLGANPSATIAAIAERNVRQALEDPDSPIHTPERVPLDPPLPGGPSLAEIRRKLGQTPEVLDPIAGIPPVMREPRSAALGLTFKEVMQGFYKADGRDNLAIRAEFLATIDDLSAFLVNPRRPVTITGMVRLTPPTGGPERTFDAKGTLDLLKRVGASTALKSLFEDGVLRLRELTDDRKLGHPDKQARIKTEDEIERLLRRIATHGHHYEMDYDLQLTPKQHEGPAYRLSGVKKIYGGSEPSPWTETTTLAITLYDTPDHDTPEHAVGSGTMHVHLDDLLKTQLPSLRVTGTDDDVRIAWAFARFFRFFLGTLRQVYLPRLEALDPFGKG